MDIDFEKTVGKKSELDLKFRETVILSVGMFPDLFTKEQLYAIYSKIYLRLREVNVVNFSLPTKSVFVNMIRKMMKQKLINEVYNDRNYVLSLSVSGMGTFEVILDNLQAHPSFARISNIYNFYKNELVF